MVLEALYSILNLETFLYMSAALIFGLMVGALPGLGPVAAITLILPITFGMDPLLAITIMICIYKSSIVGGSVTAILINTPGEPSNIATTFDGYPLSRKGQSRKAIQAALFSSTLGDLFSCFCLIILSFSLVKFVLKFGPVEMFWVMMVALILTGILAESSLWKGLFSMGLGLLLGAVGLDPMLNIPRLGVFDFMGRMEGIDLVPFLLGLFMVAEVLTRITERFNLKQDDGDIQDGDGREPSAPQLESKDNSSGLLGPSLSFKDVKESFKAFLVGIGIGAPMGILPGLGSIAANMITYTTAKKVYRNSSSTGKFGEGALPGIVAAETGNSAVVGTSLLPLLTLGIPGSTVGALLLASLLIQGVNVGPTIFQTNAPLVYGIFVMLIVSSLLMCFYGLLLVKPLVKIFKFNDAIVFPVVMVISAMAVYSTNGRLFDLWIMLGAGVLGFIMRKTGIPLAPLTISFLLSSLIEVYFRRSIQLGGGDYSILFHSGISQVLSISIGLFVMLMVFLTLKRILKGAHDRNIAG